MGIGHFRGVTASTRQRRTHVRSVVSLRARAGGIMGLWWNWLTGGCSDDGGDGRVGDGTVGSVW